MGRGSIFCLRLVGPSDSNPPAAHHLLRLPAPVVSWLGHRSLWRPRTIILMIIIIISKRSPAAIALAPTAGTWFIPHLSAPDEETSLPLSLPSVTAGIWLAVGFKLAFMTWWVGPFAFLAAPRSHISFGCAVNRGKAHSQLFYLNPGISDLVLA